MLDPVNEFDNHVGTRLLDFFDARTPWHRKLWNVGLALTMQETAETISAVRAGVLSEDSLGFLLNVVHKMVGRDPGSGTAEERQVLQSALRGKPRLDGLEYHVIVQTETTLRSRYLTQVAGALRGQQPPGAERTARAIASHLLDIGFSSNFLHRWWKFRLLHEPGTRALADVVDDAHQLALTHAQTFEVLVPVSTAIRFVDGVPPNEWRSAPEVSHWLRRNGIDVRDIRHDGGLLFSVPALDAGAAAERAAELMDRLVSRTAVGTKRQLKFLDRVWIEGRQNAFTLDPTHRGVWVKALDRENQVYNLNPSGSIDAAIELLSHLQASSPAAAVAGGWAAIEALLSEPTDRGGAADRLAMLVACSFPRAELTVLSYKLETLDNGLAAALQGVVENRDRGEIVARVLALQPPPTFPGASRSDRAAIARMIELLRNPSAVLSVVQEQSTIAFRRLYRQRNLVLHWGKTDAVALRASLRTAAPLVGAGIDRIIHAFYVDNLWPLQLVARAKIALGTVGSTTGPSCTTLLP